MRKPPKNPLRLVPQFKSCDLDMEKGVMYSMMQARKSINTAVVELTSALTQRCFAAHRLESKDDAHTLSGAVDTLIDTRDKIIDVLKPYFTFHEMDECDLENWHD